MNFLDLNFLYNPKILAFLDYILSLAKARDNIKTLKLLDKEKISVQKLYKHCE